MTARNDIDAVNLQNVHPANDGAHRFFGWAGLGRIVQPLRGNQQPAGDPDTSNDAWDLWIKPGSGGNPPWPYYAFVHKQPTAGGTLDLLGIVKYLVDRQLIRDTLWLASVEFGNEFIDGDGWCAMDRFDVTIA